MCACVLGHSSSGLGYSEVNSPTSQIPDLMAGHIQDPMSVYHNHKMDLATLLVLNAVNEQTVDGGCC